MYHTDKIISNALYGSEPYEIAGMAELGLIDPKGTMAERNLSQAYATYRSALLEVKANAKTIKSAMEQAVENMDNMLAAQPSYGIDDGGLYRKGQDYAMACGKALLARDNFGQATFMLLAEERKPAEVPS